jgi:serine/threonine protein kinase
LFNFGISLDSFFLDSFIGLNIALQSSPLVSSVVFQGCSLNIVTEFCQGGDLFEYLKSSSFSPETSGKDWKDTLEMGGKDSKTTLETSGEDCKVSKFVWKIVFELLSAVAYCNSKG